MSKVQLTGSNTKSKAYAWSRDHNITFLEVKDIPLTIVFGRSEDLALFLLSWNHREIEIKCI